MAASKRPSKKPKRETINVESAWLMPELPPLPKLPKLPPMPPSRRDTMEVKLDWLEDEEKSPAKKRKALPPPIPREEPDDPPRSSRSVSRRPKKK